MKINTTQSVMSIRLPKNIHTEIKTYCKANNLTVSEYVRKSFTEVGTQKMFDVNIPDDLSNYLVTIAGGSTAGILAYKGVYSIFKDKFPDWKENELEAASIVSGVGVAMLTAYGIGKLIEALNK